MKKHQKLSSSAPSELKKYIEGQRRLEKLIATQPDKRTEYELELYLVYLTITNLLIKSHQHKKAEAYIARAENLSKSIQTVYYRLKEQQWTDYMVNQAGFCLSKSLVDLHHGKIKASGEDAFYGICIMEHIFEMAEAEMVKKTDEMTALYLELKACQARALGEDADEWEENLEKAIDIWEDISHRDNRYFLDYAKLLLRASDSCPETKRIDYLHCAREIYMGLSDEEGGYLKEILEMTILYAEELLLDMPKNDELLGEVFAETEFYILCAETVDSALSKLLADLYFLEYLWAKECGNRKEARGYLQKYLKQYHRWLTGGGIFKNVP